MLPALLVPTAITRLTPVLTSAPASRLAQIGLRLGLSATKATAENILRLVKNNKITAALVAWEVFGVADELVQAFMKDEPSLKSLKDPFLDWKPDEMPEDGTDPGSKMDDELLVLSAAVAKMGSLEAVLNLKRALELSPAVFVHYRERRELGRKLR